MRRQRTISSINKFDINNHYVTPSVGYYEENMRTIIIMLKVMGVYPLQNNRQGYSEFKLLSWIMLYSVLLYVIYVDACILSSIGYINKEVNHQRSLSFYNTIDITWYVSAKFIIILIPIIMWPETKAFAQYLREWKIFLSHMNTIRPPTLKRFHKISVIFLIIGLIYEVTRDVIEFTVLEWKMKNKFVVFLHYFSYFIPNILGQVLAAFWYFTCYAICSAAETTLMIFKHEMTKPESSISSFEHYRNLWLQLSKLARQTGSAFTFTYCFYILYIFTLVAISLFFLTNDFTRAIGWAVIQIFDAVVMCFLICSVCNSGHNVQKQIGEDFQQELLFMKSSLAKYHIHYEIKQFLRVIEYCPPNVSLGGFVTVNRRLIVSLGATLVTYLVILVQFNMSMLSNTSNNNSSSSSIQQT